MGGAGLVVDCKKEGRGAAVGWGLSEGSVSIALSGGCGGEGR